MKAQQVIVEEILDDETVQRCAAIKVGDYIVFADNGFVVNLKVINHIKIIEELPWIDISDAVVGDEII